MQPQGHFRIATKSAHAGLSVPGKSQDPARVAIGGGCGNDEVEAVAIAEGAGFVGTAGSFLSDFEGGEWRHSEVVEGAGKAPLLYNSRYKAKPRHREIA